MPKSSTLAPSNTYRDTPCDASTFPPHTSFIHHVIHISRVIHIFTRALHSRGGNIYAREMDERPAGDQHDEEPGSGDAASSGDLLCDIAAHVTALDASPGARTLLAEILAATLQAFTRTTSVRDPLPATAPHSAEESLAILGGLDHLRSSLAAIEATWQVRAEQKIREADRREGAPASVQGKGAASEVGIAGRVSPASASFSLASARRLVQHLPGTFGRLWDGRLPVRQAVTVASTLATADPETCAAIDKMISEDPLFLAGKGDRQLRSDLQRMIQQLEPERSRDRAERAARARHVTMTPLADGMARVNAVLRGVDAAGLMKSLQRSAESLRAAGVKHSVPALEADLLVGAVLERSDPPSPDAGRARRSPGLELGIVITDTALLGRDNEAECAQLEGYGTIPAHIITDTLRGTPPGFLRSSGDDHPDEEVSVFYRRLYTSPSTGDLVGMESRARAFPAGLARMIRWRDVTCRTPWCNAIIRQIDHAQPHHRGGLTSYANGQGLCTRCNLAKELGLWTLTPCGPSLAPASPATGWSWNSPHGAHGLSPGYRLVDRREPANAPPPADPSAMIPPTENPDPPNPTVGSGPSEPPESPPGSRRRLLPKGIPCVGHNRSGSWAPEWQGSQPRSLSPRTAITSS